MEKDNVGKLETKLGVTATRNSPTCQLFCMRDRNPIRILDIVLVLSYAN